MINFYSIYNNSKQLLWHDTYYNGIHILSEKIHYPEHLLIDVTESDFLHVKHLIKKNIRFAFFYTNQMGKRWLEVEPLILSDPFFSYCYAHDVIKGRWEEAESIILTDNFSSIRYAECVLKDRWKEAENNLLNVGGYWCHVYAKDVIKGRWIEAESIIESSIWKKNYEEHFKITL